MLVVRIEMWPQGDASRAYGLGVVEIANMGGSDTRGDYSVRLLKSTRYARSPGTWKAGAVRGFPRTRLGPYDLLLRCLAAVIGDRNPEAHEAVNARMAELEAEAEKGPLA
jgi:hypothetical protein